MYERTACRTSEAPRLRQERSDLCELSAILHSTTGKLFLVGEDLTKDYTRYLFQEDST